MPAPAPGWAAEKYPSVAELELLMFGKSSPAVAVDLRLNNLENAVFRQSYPALPVPERITQLARTLTGAEIPGIDNREASAQPAGGQDLRIGRPREETQPPPPDMQPFWQDTVSTEDLNRFTLDYVNDRRNQQGLSPLQWDPLAEKVGRELLTDLTQRNTVSHSNAQNENPDIRYTKSGGNDSVLESVVAVRTSGRIKLNRALVRQLFDVLEQRQDDRQALFSSDATQFGFCFGQTPENDRLIGVAEIVTKRGEFAALPAEVQVGDKVEVKGTIAAPYRFDKISLAWEGGLPGGEPFDDSDEALPYFAPLDYEAHGQKAERNWEGRIRVMQMLGVAAIVAGSIFMPPVALAAPLLMAAPAAAGGGKPKAISDIPVHGGVKVDGNGSFSHKVSVSKDGKEGIYYITVWATTGDGATPVPISRRAVIARGGTTEAANEDEGEKKEPKSEQKPKDKPKSSAKKSKGDKRAADEAPLPPSPAQQSAASEQSDLTQAPPSPGNEQLDPGNAPQN
jgi:uncharacterized protein YkwD